MGRLPDHVWRRAIELFLLAGDCECDGYLPPVEDIAWRLRREPAEIEADLQELAKVEIVRQTEHGWLVINFTKRQDAATPTERWHQWKERKRKEEYYQQSANDITNDITNEPTNVLPTERLTDTDTDIDKIKILAAGAAFPANPRPEKPPVSQSRPLKHPDRDAVIKHFLIKTGIPAPKTDNAHIKATQKRWWTPVDDLLELVDCDVGRAGELIDLALARLKDVTVTSPQSIIETAKAVLSENHRSPPDLHQQLAEEGYVVHKAD